MSDPRIPLRDPWFAGILAFLLPGAGHLYQRRFFKAAIYAVCIWGTFLFGMSMAEWKAVYYSQTPGKRNFGYLAQAGFGLPGILAYVQSNRYYKPQNDDVLKLNDPLSAEFDGEIVQRQNGEDVTLGQVRGQITFGTDMRGTFRGTTVEGQTVDLELGGGFHLDRPIAGNPQRGLTVSIIGNSEYEDARLVGSIPRPLTNWLTAPLEEAEEQRLHKTLGRRFELALVYTWIAGLLNILVVWDALEGPAYGYGDEEESPGGEPGSPEGQKQPEDTSSPAATDSPPELAETASTPPASNPGSGN